MTASGTSSSVSKQHLPMAGPSAQQILSFRAPSASIASTAFFRISPTELRQPQCTAAITPASASQSRAGTQSAVKHMIGRPLTAVTSPSAS